MESSCREVTPRGTKQRGKGKKERMAGRRKGKAFPHRRAAKPLEVKTARIGGPFQGRLRPPLQRRHDVAGDAAAPGNLD